MLIPADDYPVHQTPEPLAHATGERNFYDRYFFNGYSRDGALFFGCALGLYPQLGIADAAFSVRRDGVQHNLRASDRAAGFDRLFPGVGPIRIEIVEPHSTLRVHVHAEEHGVRAELTFQRGCRPLLEPRFVRRSGGRLLFDYTRVTQLGRWRGWLEIDGEHVDVGSADVLGTRDRSWGIRPVGARDSQPADVEPQFYWLWAPLQFDDAVTLFHVNTDAEGRAWARHASVVPRDDGSAVDVWPEPSCDLTFRPGTRHAAGAELHLRGAGADGVEIQLEPILDFYMSGLGYLHPEWGHGLDHDGAAIARDRIVVAEADPNDPLHLHVQALCRATLRRDGKREEGIGILEQLILGRHEPSGLRGLLGPE